MTTATLATLTAHELAERYTVEDITRIVQEAKTAASIAAQSYLDDWTASTGGNEYGEPMYCGFAWTNILGIKGNTRIGKRFKQAGVERDWQGVLQIYNPSGHAGQSMDVKEAGARAAALVFKHYGFTAYAGSRAD